jgi:hypothetical protein
MFIASKVRSGVASGIRVSTGSVVGETASVDAGSDVTETIASVDAQQPVASKANDITIKHAACSRRTLILLSLPEPPAKDRV